MNLTPTQARAVNLLTLHGPLDTHTLAQRLGLNVSAVAASLTSLESRAIPGVKHFRMPGAAYATWQVLAETPHTETDVVQVSERATQGGDSVARSPAAGKLCTLVHAHEGYAWVVNPDTGHVCRISSSSIVQKPGYVYRPASQANLRDNNLAGALSEANSKAAQLEREAEQYKVRIFQLEAQLGVASKSAQEWQQHYQQAVASLQKPGTYILWSPGAVVPPSKTYPNLAEGQRVAKIMAERHPGQVFNLCRLVEKHQFIKPVPVKSGHTVEKL